MKAAKICKIIALTIIIQYWYLNNYAYRVSWNVVRIDSSPVWTAIINYNKSSIHNVSVLTCFDSIFSINFKCFLFISYIISGVKRLSNVFVKYLDERTTPDLVINNLIYKYTWHISNRLLTVDGSVYIKIMWEACELLSCDIPAVQLRMCLQYRMKQKIETMLYIHNK